MKTARFLAGLSTSFIFLAWNAAAVQQLTLDATHTGLLRLPGQKAQYVFSGAQGQRLYFDSLSLDTNGLRAKLLTPAGNPILDVSLDSESEPVYLPYAGNYTLMIDPDGDATGTFAFRMLDIANQPAVSLNATNSVTISPSELTVVLRFEANAGQKVALESVSWSGGDNPQAEWFLVNPANRVVGNTRAKINNDLGTNLLRVSGTYLVVVQGLAQGGPPISFQFRIRDVSDTPVPASGFNIVRSGEINPGETNSFEFTAPAGTPTYYDALVPERLSDTGFEIIAPDGQIIVSRNSGRSWFGNATFDYGPFVLQQSGTYTIRLIGNSGGYYRFRLLNLWSNALPVAYGVTNSGTFSETNATVVYALTAYAGQRLFFDSLVGSESGWLGVWRGSHDGWHHTGSDINDFWITANAPEPLYFVLSGQVRDPTASYRFSIISLDQAPAMTVPLDTTVTNSFSVPYAAHVYRFNVTSSQRLFVDSQSANPFGRRWDLFDPDGNPAAWNFLGGDSIIERAVPGTYALAVGMWSCDETPNADYSFRIVSMTAVTNTLTLGSAYSNSITAVGQEHHYTFSGTLGMRLYYDALQAPTNPIPLRIIGPGGSRVWEQSSADVDSSAPFTLPRTGTYTLIFGGQTDAVGPYSFRLIDVSQPPASGLTLGTVYRGTNGPFRAAIFRVPVTAGRQLFCDSMPGSQSGDWSLFDLDNARIASASVTLDLEPTPRGTGTGVLVLANNSSEPATYEFRVLEPVQATNTIAIGAVVSNYLSDAGNEHSLEFHAVAGQRLYLDALDNGSEQVWILAELLDRSGLLLYTYKNQDAGLLTVPATGTYTLRVHNSSSGPATYRFRLLDLAAQPALSLSTPVSGQLDPPIQTHIYRIVATAGQKIRFQSIGASSPDAYWLVQDPFNNQIVGGNIQADLGTVFFPASGVYALIIQGYGSGPDPISYQIQATDATDAAVPPAGFGSFAGQIGQGVTNYVFFNASAGTPIYIDSLTNNYSVTLRLRDTNGLIVLETPPGGGSYGVPDPGFCVLPSSGTYTLEIEPFYGGEYAIRLLDLTADAPLLPLGAECAATFTNGFQTDVYRFLGAGGQAVFYDSLMPGWQRTCLALLNSVGNVIAGSVFPYSPAESDHGPIRLAGAGTHYLVIMNNSESALEYKFRLLDVAAGMRIELGINYTNELPPRAAEIVHFTSPPAAYYFDMLETSWGVSWSHIRAGAAQAANYEWGDFESSSVVSGTNFIIMQNYSDSTQTWQYRVLAPLPVTNTLAFGTVYSNVLTPGQDHWYAFTCSQGQRLYVDALVPRDIHTLVVQTEVSDPSGNQLGWPYWFDSLPPLRIIHPGTYWLRIHNFSDQLATYVFRVLDVAAQPVISLDVTNSVTVNPGVLAQLFRLFVTNQVRLYLDSLNTEWTEARWTLYDALNRCLGENYLAADMEISGVDLSGELLLVSYHERPEPFTHTFRIIPGNHAPVFTSPSTVSINEQTTLRFTNIVYDPEAPNDQITFTLAGSVPTGLSINPATGVITWTPSETQGPSTNTFTVIATDDGMPAMSDSALFTVVVNEVNQAPVLTVPSNQLINEHSLMSVSASASDFDIPPNSLAFALVSAPNGATINPTTGQITWTPTEAQGPSTNLFVVSVTDTNPWALVDNQLSTTNSFTVIVNEVNSAPVLPAQTNRTINELTLMSVTNTATDADIPANALTYQLINPPAGATISTNGVITWTPTEAQGPGVYTITTVVTDNGTPPLSATNSFTVTVNEINSPPALNVPPNTSINELATLTTTVSATDTDIPVNPLSFSLISPPTGMVINPTSGLITWTPTEAQGPSTNTIVVVVTDLNTNAVNAQQLSTTNTFTVVVNEVNSAPVLTVPPNQTVHAGAYVSVSATATDMDIPANTLGFALVSGPAGLTVGTEGLITWQTTDAYANTTNTVTIRVTDNGVPPMSSTNSFIITVLARPVITSIKHSNEVVTVTWTSIPGTVYRLQYKTNLTDPAWLAVPGDVTASGTTASKTDNPGTTHRRFYRVIVP
ncbi:MAG: putative Ig domain-containing protein [Verrucomicrobiales bacterium]|nr:putative Ig domain-containing protein [Verrucomicrobiales bacterium]